MEAIPIPKRVSFFTSGYHPARFLEEVDSYFYCAICAWVVRNPQGCSLCEALYCKSCHDRMASLREDICSCCHSAFQPAALRIYPRTVYFRYRLACSFVNFGCSFESSMRDMSEHEDQCPYRQVECENPHCWNQFRLLDRPFRDKLVCSQRCWDCHELLQLVQSQAGTTQCLDFFVSCVARHRDQMRVSLQQHYQSRLDTAQHAVEKETLEIEHLQRKLNSIRKQIANS